MAHDEEAEFRMNPPLVRFDFVTHEGRSLQGSISGAALELDFDGVGKPHNQTYRDNWSEIHDLAEKAEARSGAPVIKQGDRYRVD